MKQAAAELNFEEAALLRDQMIVLKKHLQDDRGMSVRRKIRNRCIRIRGANVQQPEK